MKPAKERQEPLPLPSCRQIINAGQEYFSARREATMPTTPWCHCSPASTRACLCGRASAMAWHSV